MSTFLTRPLPFGLLFVALAGWSCSSQQSPVEPSAESGLSLATAATYTVRDLGTLGGPFSQALGINDAGAVVGSSSLGAFPDTRLRAFVWRSGVMTNLGALAGGLRSEATAINQDGIIVGWSENSSGEMRAVRWKDGARRNLGTLGGRNSQATAINVFGVIVGWSETASGHRHAFIWKDGVMKDLGTMGGTFSTATGINRGGAVVGRSTTATSGSKNHAFKWKDGVFKDLGTGGTQSSGASAVNTKGQIVGFLGPSTDAAGEELDWSTAFLFYQDVMTILPGYRHPSDIANAISPGGIVVGSSEDPRSEEEDYAEEAWVWENGTTQGLPKLAPGHSGAHGVNLAGNIVGFGPSASGNTHAMLWRRQ
jgi:probable HAF family extracellular repeat protein